MKRVLVRLALMLFALGLGHFFYLLLTIRIDMPQDGWGRIVAEAVRRHAVLAPLGSPWVNARWADIRVGPMSADAAGTTRAEALLPLREAFGDVPAECAAEPLSFSRQVLAEESDHVRERVRYSSCGQSVPAFLLVPKGTSGPYPAAVALHSTAEDGKAHLIDPGSPYRLPLALELVRRGYVVIVPDAVTFGERAAAGGPREFYQAYPNWSLGGRMLFDHQRAIDVLTSLPMVDPTRIIATGHSLGGHNALYLAAFDERVRAVVSSCPFERIATDPMVERWTRDGFPYFPKQRWHPGAWDVDTVLKAIAPRSVFQVTALLDGNFNHPFTMGQIHEAAAPYFPSGRLQTRIFLGGHGFPPHLRREAWDWLRQQLSQTGA